MDIKDVVGAILSTPITKLSLRERRAHLFVAKLRKVPLFTQIIDRMVKKESVRQIAKWVSEQPEEMKGELAGCSVETIRGYLNYLDVKVNRPRVRVVKGLPGSDDLDDIQKNVAQEIPKLDEATMLRYAFVIQRERVRELNDFEKKVKRPIPFGNKAMKVLMETAVKIREVELSAASLRKSATPDGLVPPEMQLLPEVQEIAKLDRVDQDLIRQAFSITIDLIEQEAGIGQYSYRGRDKHIGEKEQRNVEGINDVAPKTLEKTSSNE